MFDYFVEFAAAAAVVKSVHLIRILVEQFVEHLLFILLYIIIEKQNYLRELFSY